MMTFAAIFSSKCQSQKLSAQDKQLLIDAADDLADCKSRVKELSLLLKDTALLKDEMIKLNAAIQSADSTINKLKQEVAKGSELINFKDERLSKLTEINVDLEKKANKADKKWAISVFSGYGASGNQFGTVVIGVGFSHKIIGF